MGLENIPTTWVGVVGLIVAGGVFLGAGLLRIIDRLADRRLQNGSREDESKRTLYLGEMLECSRDTRDAIRGHREDFAAHVARVETKICSGCDPGE